MFVRYTKFTEGKHALLTIATEAIFTKNHSILCRENFEIRNHSILLWEIFEILVKGGNLVFHKPIINPKFFDNSNSKILIIHSEGSNAFVKKFQQFWQS